MEQKLRIGKPNVNIIEASGEINITENGTYDVRQYKDAKVNVVPTKEITITENGIYDVKEYGTANIEVIGETDAEIKAFYLPRIIDRSINAAPAPLFNNINKVGKYAFAECNSLKSVELPDSILMIKNSAFEYCSSLNYIKLSNTLEEISLYAFYNCDNLESIIIPSSVKNISNDAFTGCDNLTIYCEISEAEKPSGWEDGWNKLDYQNNLIPVVWGFGSISSTLNGITYRLSESELKAYVERVDIDPEETNVRIEAYITKDDKIYEVVKIPNHCLISNKKIEVLTVPNIENKNFAALFEDIELDPDWAIYEVPETLREVILLETSNTSLDYSFAANWPIEKITLPKNITNISSMSLAGCRQLTNIIFEGTVSEWNSITFGEDWNSNIPATYVQCSDGKVQL